MFIQRLRAADATKLAALNTALKATDESATALLRSAFDLPVAQQVAIQSALDDTFGQAIALTFETAPELVGGIEFSAQGQKLAWSIAGYLSELSSALDESSTATGAA